MPKYNLEHVALVMLALIPITLNLGLMTNTLSIMALSLFCLWRMAFSPKERALYGIKKIDVLYFSIFYLAQVIGLIYTENKELALKHLGTKFSLILLPFIVVFLLRNGTIKLNKNKVYLLALSFSASILILFYFILFPYFLYVNQDIQLTLNELMPNDFGHVYFGMFSVFSFYTAYYIYKENIFLRFRNSILIASFLLFVIPILLTSRTSTFTGFILLFSILIFDRENRKPYLLFFICLVLGVATIFSFKPDKLRRFTNVISTSQNVNPLFHRANNFQCAIEIFKDHPLIGVGTGSVQPYLDECYKENRYWGLKHHFNSHNEYLEEMARHGLFGLASILFFFIYPLYLSIRSRDFFYLGFLLTIIICSFTENIFSRQIGVVFFAFFNTIFYVSNKSFY